MTIHDSNKGTQMIVKRSLYRSVFVGSLALSLYGAPAVAQNEASSADTAAARELAIEGLKLADAGHCAQAIDKLFRAEKLRHSPIVLGRLGECQIEEGKIVDGTEDLQRLLHEPVPTNAPANLVKARERAQAALDAAKPKIAMLLISVRGATDGVTVTIDGQPVPALLLERDRPTDPGEHVVEASAPGYFKSTRRLTLGAGEKQEVALRLRVDPQAVVAPPQAQPTQEANNSNSQAQATAPQSGAKETSVPPPPMQESPPNHTASTILWLAGGAVAVTGGVFGYLAMSGKNDLDKQCVNNACPPSARDSLDAANLNATLSTVLVGVGAASLALGTVIYFTEGPSSNSERSTGTLRPRAFVGLNRIGIEGNF